MVLAFPSIVVPSVIGISSKLNPDEILQMTPDEASWLGMFSNSISFMLSLLNFPRIVISATAHSIHFSTASLLFIVQPIGLLLSGFIVDTVGRKRAITIVSIVPAFAWILLPNATSQYATFIGFALLGIGVGLSGPITYVSEIR